MNQSPFQMSERVKELRSKVRDFIEQEVIPVEKRIENGGEEGGH